MPFIFCAHDALASDSMPLPPAGHMSLSSLPAFSRLYTFILKAPELTRMVVQGQLVEPAVCFSDL